MSERRSVCDQDFIKPCRQCHKLSQADSIDNEGFLLVTTRLCSIMSFCQYEYNGRSQVCVVGASEHILQISTVTEQPVLLMSKHMYSARRMNCKPV